MVTKSTHSVSEPISEAYAQRFGGIGRLYGLEAMRRLHAAHVCVVGIGGVGSWAIEALARTGVGSLTLVDLDDVCVTNSNRQLHALDDTVGRPKIEVMAERARLINPEVELHLVHDFLSATSIDAIIATDFDYVIDAIDQFRNKAVLVKHCFDRSIPLVVCGGAGGKRDPSRVRVADLTQTRGDKLLRILRKTLRQKLGFSRRGRWNVAAVFSDEEPRFPTPDGEVCDTRTEGALRLDCASGFGAATFLTGTFGFMAASVVVDAIAATPSANEDIPTQGRDAAPV